MKNNIGTIGLVALAVILVCTSVSAGCQLSTRSAKSAAEKLLDHEKYNRWEKAWEMLHPDSQAVWGDKNVFIDKMDQPLRNLKEFEIGKAKRIPSWTSPGTSKIYSDVVEMPVTFIYSTVSGDTQRSIMIHAVAHDNRWKFFQHQRE